MSGKKCPEGCTCARHSRAAESYRSGSTKCEPGCTCGRHKRVITEDHRQKIIEANKARRGESHKCPEGCTCARHQAYYRGGSTKGRTLSPGARERIAEGANNRDYGDLGPPLPRHPKSDGKKGYIYIIEYDTGMVKVGRTTSPRQRIKGQLYIAARFGVEPRNIWLSSFHENYKSTERELLKRLGTPTQGAEYFETTYAEVIGVAQALVGAYDGNIRW